MAADHLTFGPFELDLARRRLTRDGAEVRLGSRAFDILCALAAAGGEVVTKDELMAAIWPGTVVEENAIQVHVSALRKALGEPGCVVTVPGRGYRFLALSPSCAEARSPALPDKPSIAVLPFGNLSGDPKQDYFAEGIAEDIITALARSRWFFVIARNSSFAFKGKSVDTRQVARDLGVRYVLEGSVRKAAERVRITAQLVDAPSAVQLWAERFDLELRDIFAVQDEIADRVVGAIEPELLKSEGARASARAAGDLSAWDLVRQGTWQFHQITRPTHFKARELFRAATVRDPLLAEAHVWLGRACESIVGYGWSEDPAADLREAVRSCLRGVQLDERDPYAHYALAMSYLFSGALEEAIQAAEKALRLGPSLALAHLGLGMARLYAGDAAASIAPLEHGLRLNPFDPQNFHWFRLAALAHYFSGSFEEGLSAAVRAAQVRPDWRPALEAITVCELALGRLDEARRSAAQAGRLAPPDSDILEQLRLRNPGWAETLAAALAKAGTG